MHVGSVKSSHCSSTRVRVTHLELRNALRQILCTAMTSPLSGVYSSAVSTTACGISMSLNPVFETQIDAVRDGRHGAGNFNIVTSLRAGFSRQRSGLVAKKNSVVTWVVIKKEGPQLRWGWCGDG